MSNQYIWKKLKSSLITLVLCAAVILIAALMQP